MTTTKKKANLGWLDAFNAFISQKIDDLVMSDLKIQGDHLFFLKALFAPKNSFLRGKH